ncbi:MAG: YdcF family protein [Armatimonadetes bacterium]|nr:YdcF family protein [Armatimonadota bacterium]
MMPHIDMDTETATPAERTRDPLLVRLLPKTTRGCVATGVLLGALGCGLALYAVVRRGARAQPTRQADAIIVLGAGCEQPGPRPRPVYRNRLVYARDLWQRGMAPHIIVTEQSPAAEAAREYLLAIGVSEDAVELENRSTTTYENLALARDVMRANGWRRCIVVSDGFHLSRAVRMCRDLGLDPQGAATPYSLIEQRPGGRVKYTLREVGVYVIYLLTGR